MVYIHNGILFSYEKRRKIVVHIIWKELEGVMFIKSIRRDKTNTRWYHSNVKFKETKQGLRLFPVVGSKH